MPNLPIKDATSRRGALQLFAAAPAVAMLPALAANVSIDQTVPSLGAIALLGREFERFWDAERTTLAFGTDEVCEKAAAATSKVVQQILAASAQTLDDFKVKARALSWCYAGEEVDFFDDMPDTTTDRRLVESIICDLLRMAVHERALS
jgi:hypothetical protein